MEISKKIDSSILDVYPFMTSSGAWPFMMIRQERIDLAKVVIEPSPVSPSLLLVLIRTDFTGEELIDYAKNTKEYANLPKKNKHAYMELFRQKIHNPRDMEQWTDMVTSVAIGIVIQVARNNGLYLKPVEADLSEVDALLGLGSKNLKTYQLFDAQLIDENN